MTRYRLQTLCLAVTGLLSVGSVHAQACKPDFGELMLAWAKQDAAQQSRELARLDFETRIQNYMLLTFEEANGKMAQLAADLDTAAARIRADEAAASTDSVLAAVARQHQATVLQADLFRIKTILEDVERLHGSLRAEPSRKTFESEGLHNVGRATLLASFADIGNASAASLADRYGVVVRVTYSESNGQYEGSVEPTSSTGMTDAAAALAVHYAGTYGPFAAFAYFIAKSEYDDAKCRDRIEQQQEKYQDAIELLPQVIIQINEGFELYSRLYRAGQSNFREPSEQLLKTHTAASERWRDLFAANAQRLVAADTVLTAAKVDDLRNRFGTDDRVTRLFNGLGRIQMAADITRLHAWLTDGQTRLLLSCGDVAGFAALEDQRDAVAYAQGSYSAIERQAGFAPLHAALQQRQAAAMAAEREAEQIGRRLKDLSCSPLPPDTAPEKVDPRLAVKTTAGKFAWHSPAAHGDQKKLTSAAFNGGFCVMWRMESGLYVCRTPGSGGDGAPYSGNFTGPSDDPRVAVLGRAVDGGFTRDKRDPSVKVQQAIGNIRLRIRELEAGHAGPLQSIAAWTSTNTVAMRRITEAHAQARVAESAERQTFEATHKAEIAGANFYVSQFLQRPADSADATRLLRDIDAPNLALPQLSAATIPSDGPVLPGITAGARVYPGLDTSMARAIERERLRAERDLAKAPQLRALSDRALAAARQFVGSPEGERIIDQLILDSTALRQLTTGQRSTLELATLDDDGNWRRTTVTDAANLPADTLLVRTEDFNRRQALYVAAAAAVQSTLGSTGESAATRRAALQGANRLASIASSTFALGNLLAGSDLLECAYITLDITLSLTPGIGWGRDIYEALVGEDLLSGEKLSTFEYSTAIVGALTGGMGDDVVDVARVLRKIDIGEPFGRAMRILDGNGKIRADRLFYTEHALQRKVQYGVEQQRVEEIIGSGSRWWDAQNQTIVIYERGVPAGQSRIGVAIDPFTKEDMAITNRVTTIMNVPDTDEKLAKKLWEGKARYRQLPSKLPTPPVVH